MTHPRITATIFGLGLVSACNGDITVDSGTAGLSAGETPATSPGSSGPTPDTTETTAPTSGASSTTGLTATATGTGTGTSTGEASDTGDGAKLDLGADTEGFADCQDAPDLILLLVGSEVWSFDPIAVEFKKLYSVACPEILGDITGFSVARDGSVWLLSLEPIDPDLLPERPMQLTRFEPDTQQCSVELYAPVVGGNSSYDCGDIAFVSQIDDPAVERLFFHSCTGGSFAIGPDGLGATFRVDPKGAPPSFEFLQADGYTSAPLTGTGDGRIYAITGAGEDPSSARFLELDQEGALVTTTPVPALKIGENGPQLALAFYGGDLYTFGVPADSTLLVTRYDLDDDDQNGVNEIEAIPAAAMPPFTPYMLVAAASPTCIPLVPPV